MDDTIIIYQFLQKFCLILQKIDDTNFALANLVIHGKKQHKKSQTTMKFTADEPGT